MLLTCPSLLTELVYHGGLETEFHARSARSKRDCRDTSGSCLLRRRAATEPFATTLERHSVPNSSGKWVAEIVLISL